MSNLVLSLTLYALAIGISMLVAVLIKGIVVSLALTRSKPQAQQAPVQPVQDDNADIAAIAAAVYAVMGAHRIVHIEAADRGRAWTATARTAHHTSHQVGRHTRR